jgi:outer membrane scaffolding protein for murein synthesis (MipA/OmpV family)
MRMNRTIGVIAGAYLVGVTGTPATAQSIDVSTPVDAPAPVEVSAGTGLTFSAGLGAAFAPDYEGSDDYNIVPFWNLGLRNLYHPETFVQLTGLQIRSNLLPDNNWRFGVSGRYLSDYDDVDDNKVEELDDVENTTLFGFTIGYDFANGLRNDMAVEVDAQYDIAEGNGGVLTPRFRWRQPWSQQMILEATLAATWASEDYMENRFAIGGGDAARSGLETHDAEEGFKNASLSGAITYRLTNSLSLTGLAAYSRLFGDAEDSPIVDDRGSANQAVGGVLLNYTF